MLRSTWLFAFPLLVAAAPTTRTAPRVEHQVHSGDRWAIVAPREWQAFKPAIRPPIVLYLSGDGRGGLPIFDGTLSPLQVGLMVEVHEDGGSLDERIARDIETLKRDRKFKLQGEPTTKPIQLADATPAVLFQVEFERLDKNRRSLYQRVYAANQTRHVQTTGWIACGISGGAFVRQAGIYDFMQANLRSLVLDTAKLDERSLASGYKALNRLAADAIEVTRRGNGLIEQKEFAEAIEAFRAALAGCDAISAAHNGLAWSLLESSNGDAQKFADAVTHAERAVELTDRRDIAALDTLAAALGKTGKRDAALATIQEALRLAPEHPELTKRLKEIESNTN